jgi:large subunit ribosomal protein L13
MKTVFAKPSTVRGDWFLVDASDKTLGRLASQIAHRLKGKHKADYSPHVDMGDHIVVVNAGKIRVTGRKLTDKIYYHHTGHIGGIKSIALEKLLSEHPERVIEFAVAAAKAARDSVGQNFHGSSDSEPSLRHRPAQDRNGTRLSQARQRSHHGE